MAVREAPAADSSVIGVGEPDAWAAADDLAPDLESGTNSSMTEAHSSQSGHRPTHLGDSYPQDWQTNLVLGLAIVETTVRDGCPR